MTQEQIQFLQDNKTMYSNFKAVGVIAHLSNIDANKFLDIAKEYDSTYTTNLWCGDCVMNLVDYVYTQYNKTKKDEENYPETEIVKVVIPIISTDADSV